MIVVSCLNPALDVTYAVPELRVGESHRVAEVTIRAGGKGTNVVRVLAQLGASATLVGPVGGPGGTAFGAELERDGLGYALVPIAGETRRTVAVVAGSSATMLNEPGPVLTLDEWLAVVTAFTDAVRGASVAVLSGSRPPGTPPTAYGELVAAARAAGSRVILDAEGDSLTSALAAGPSVVKINAAEAQAATGVADPFAAAAQLVEQGAEAAVITCGGDGLVALVDGHRIVVSLPASIDGNPTGAGDALSAVLARGLASGASWDDALADAVAVSAAAVAVPHAGEFDTALAARLRPGVTIERY